MTSAGGASARYPYGYTRRFLHVLGHRDTGRTSCPGAQLYYQLSELRERIGERKPTGAKVLMTAELPDVVTYSPDGFTFSGTLTDEFGAPIAGATVPLERLGRTGWRPIDEPTTDAEGDFSGSAHFKRNKVVRWEFPGDETYRPSRGDGALVTVAPLITLDTSTTSAEPGERIDVTGTITPSKAEGMKLVIEHYDGVRWRRVARKPVTPERGVFTKRPGFREEGDYRLSVTFAGDAVNAPSISPYVEVTVSEPVLPF
jgi:hypothetical protein